MRLFKKHKIDFTECVHSLALLFQMPTQGKMVCWKAEIGKKIISYALENRKKKTFSVLVHNVIILPFSWSRYAFVLYGPLSIIVEWAIDHECLSKFFARLYRPFLHSGSCILQ